MVQATDPATRIKDEAQRLYQLFKSKLPDITLEVCEFYAPLIVEIKELKQKKNAVLLAHTYVSPLVLYGVADYIGDSLFLSKKAMETAAEVIVFAGVRFMAETAKVLNPQKTVLLPSLEAGCSLADSIKAEDVRKLKAEHPHAWVVTYINTSVEVKSEADVCCTSANMLEVINAVPVQEVIFVPDRFMAENIKDKTTKTLFTWDGTCEVHEKFTEEHVKGVREFYPQIKIAVHPEAPKNVVAAADFVGSTEGMMNFAKQSPAKQFMFVTECGLSDRARVEFPDKEFYGTCLLCPYMKKNDLNAILQVLKDPRPDQVIQVEEALGRKARRAVDKMFELTAKK